jgi:hypothetical protein
VSKDPSSVLLPLALFNVQLDISIFANCVFSKLNPGVSKDPGAVLLPPALFNLTFLYFLTVIFQNFMLVCLKTPCSSVLPPLQLDIPIFANCVFSKLHVGVSKDPGSVLLPLQLDIPIFANSDFYG